MYWLLEKTIMSFLTALIILVLKKIIGKKANPLWHYYIWFILFVQLLLPSLPRSNFSISTVIPLNKISRGLISMNQTTAIQNETFIYLNLQNLVVTIWIIGTLSFLAYFVLRYASFKRNTLKLQEIDEDEVLFAFESIKNKLKINKSIPIIEYNDIPMIVGFFKPILLIPKEHDNMELEVLFYHELLHYKYFDILINWIAIFIRCLFWFNPFVWYSFKVMQNDCEVACDYRIIKSMDIKNRKLYAEILLKYAAIHMSSTDDTPVLGVPSMADSKSEIKKRIYNITKFKRYGILNAVFIVVLTSILSIICLTKVATKAEISLIIPSVNSPVDYRESSITNPTNSSKANLTSSETNNSATMDLSSNDELDESTNINAVKIDSLPTLKPTNPSETDSVPNLESITSDKTDSISNSEQANSVKTDLAPSNIQSPSHVIVNSAPPNPELPSPVITNSIPYNREPSCSVTTSKTMGNQKSKGSNHMNSHCGNNKN